MSRCMTRCMSRFVFITLTVSFLFILVLFISRMGGTSGKPTGEINSEAKSFVDDKISTNKIVVFSKTYCPYCKMAKSALTEVGLTSNDFLMVELDKHRSSDFSSGEVQDYLQTISSIRTVCREFCIKLAIMSAKAFVDEKIASDIVVVFSKTYCPHCKTAKTALNETGVQFTLLEIDDLPNVDAIQDYLRSISGIRSVPQVFIGGEFISDGSKTKKMKETGELQKILKKCGAL